MREPSENPGQTRKVIGRILIVDDDESILKLLKKVLERDGWGVDIQTDPLETVSFLRKTPVDIAMVDIRMPGMSGIELCGEIKEQYPDMEVVVMTGAGSVDVAVDAMRAGAYDFLMKPFHNLDVVTMRLKKALKQKELISRTATLERQVTLADRFEKMIGNSAKMKKVFRLIESVAPTDSTVLILGESGTGKELVARAIHDRSTRSSNEFYALNCSALIESLLESELFGHTKGAFTGAAGHRKGLFQSADGGTVFLDEISSIPLSTQAKLLRVLQEGEVKPVGSDTVRKVDVRVITATNIDLMESVKEGNFREDLYYRINVIKFDLPPLRERGDDMAILAHHFLKKYGEKLKKDVQKIDNKAMAAITNYRWPGNVRELENVIERAVVLCHGNEIRMDELPDSITTNSDPQSAEESGSFDMPFRDAKKKAVDRFERRYLQDILARANGIMAQAARIAEMDPSNFRKLVKQHDLDPEEFKNE